MNNILIVIIFAIFVSLTITAYNLGKESRPEVVRSEKKDDKKIVYTVSPTNPPNEILGVSNEVNKQNGDFFSYTLPLSWEQKKPRSGGVITLSPQTSENVLIEIEDFTHINADETPQALAQKLSAGQTLVSSEEIVVGDHTGIRNTFKTGQGHKIEIYVGGVMSYANFPQDGGEKKVAGTHVISLVTKTQNSTDNLDIFDTFLSTLVYAIK